MPAALAAAAPAAIAILSAWAIWTLPQGLAADARVALIVTVVAMVGWIGTRLPEGLVVLAAGLALVLTGTVGEAQLFATLGSELVWLLVAAFLIAAVVRESGLAERPVAPLTASRPRVGVVLVVLSTAIALTALVIPSTSGRVALLLPVFAAILPLLPDARLVRAVSLLFPTAILLSAGGSLLGAVAHLVAVEAIAAMGGPRSGDFGWLMLAGPLAMLATLAGAVLLALVGLWVTEPLHGLGMALVRATGGRTAPARVTGPEGQPVDSVFGILGGTGPRTAVIEMAAAAGLSLVPRDQRNPMLTTSYGVGQLILAALDAGVERILVGCGDTGISDGGVGLAQALCARLLDENGAEIGHGGGALLWLHEIDTSGPEPRLRHVRIDAAANWHNMLLGPKGVARVFGPQKGATPSQVEDLDRAMGRWAAAIRATTRQDVGAAPGAGASGGLGAGLIAFAGATLHPRYIIRQNLDFDRLLGQADLVITAEGSLDGQSPWGKVPCEVGRRAAERGIPTIALAGTIGRGVDQTLAHGVSAFASILTRPCTLEEAIRDGEKLLRRVAEDAVRMLAVGLRRRGSAGRPEPAQRLA